MRYAVYHSLCCNARYNYVTAFFRMLSGCMPCYDLHSAMIIYCMSA